MARCAVLFCVYVAQCGAHVISLRSAAAGAALETAPVEAKKDVPLHLSACNYMSPEHVAKLAGGQGARVVVTGNHVKEEADITDACHAFKFAQSEWFSQHDSPSMHAGSYLEFHTLLNGQKKIIAQYNLWDNQALRPYLVQKTEMYYLVLGQDHIDEKTAFKLFENCQQAAFVKVVQETPECKAWKASQSGATASGAFMAISLATIVANLF